VQQHGHPGQRVLHPEPPPHLLGDPGQRPALIRIPARGRPGIQDPFQLGHLGGSELALRAAGAPGRQRRLPSLGAIVIAPWMKTHICRGQGRLQARHETLAMLT